MKCCQRHPHTADGRTITAESRHTEKVCFCLDETPIQDFCLKDVEWVGTGTSCSNGLSGRTLAACCDTALITQMSALG